MLNIGSDIVQDKKKKSAYKYESVWHFTFDNYCQKIASIIRRQYI